MPSLFVTKRDGETVELQGGKGLSVMEVIRDNGFDELLALCGGSCSCATCHVYVDAGWTAKVGGPHEDEADLLDSSDHRKAESRLSCQIRVRDEIDGLIVSIPERQG